MFPYFNLFGKTIPIYTLCVIAGVLLTLLFVYKGAKRNKLDEVKMTILILLAFTGAFFGCHLLYGLLNIDKITYLLKNISRVTSFSLLLKILRDIFGGGVFYGGLFGAIATGFIYLKKTKSDINAYVDIAACAIPLFHCVGRIGCFFGGCCYGIKSNFGISYQNIVAGDSEKVSRFPVQLLESFLNILLFLLLVFLYERFKKSGIKGRIMPIYLIVYAAMRFILEFFRGDELRGKLWIFSTSQYISAVLILIVTTYIFKEVYVKNKINGH